MATKYTYQKSTFIWGLLFTFFTTSYSQTPQRGYFSFGTGIVWRSTMIDVTKFSDGRPDSYILSHSSEKHIQGLSLSAEANYYMPKNKFGFTYAPAIRYD